MSLWGWLAALFARNRSAIPRAPVTPSDEHRAADTRLGQIQRDVDRVERLARDYRRLDGLSK